MHGIKACMLCYMHGVKLCLVLCNMHGIKLCMLCDMHRVQEELKALKALVATHVQNSDSPTKLNGLDDGETPLSPVRELEKSPVDAVL